MRTHDHSTFAASFRTLPPALRSSPPIPRGVLAGYCRKNRLRLPSVLLDWLEIVGAVTIDGHRTLSLRASEAGDPRRHIIAQKLDAFEREPPNCYHLAWALPFLQLDRNRFYCLWLSRITAGDCPVVIWDLSQRVSARAFESPPLHHRSFGRWICQRLGVPVVRQAKPARKPAAPQPPLLARSATLHAVLAAVRAFPGAKPGRGASAARVKAAEAVLGVTFPKAYRQFLSELGTLDLAGDVVLGIPPARRGGPERSVVARTIQERTAGVLRLPAGLVALRDLGNGDLDCLHLGKGSDDCPVVTWVHDAPAGLRQRPLRCAPSFRLWLIDRLRDAAAR
jgi:hypothetical protein